jgi:hypothetical protein
VIQLTRYASESDPGPASVSANALLTAVWDNGDLSALKQLTGADFDVVNMGTIYTNANVPQGAAPVTSSFTANPASHIRWFYRASELDRERR